MRKPWKKASLPYNRRIRSKCLPLQSNNNDYWFFRWEVIADYINQHSKSSQNRQSKEVLAKAKDLQKSDHGASHLKQHANSRAYENFTKDVKSNINQHEQVESVRFDCKLFLCFISKSIFSKNYNRYCYCALDLIWNLQNLVRFGKIIILAKFLKWASGRPCPLFKVTPHSEL